MRSRKYVQITCILLLSSLLFSNCKKKKQSEIVMEYSIPFINNLEIDTTNVGVFVERESFDFPTNLDGELAKNNTNKSKIKSAKLVSMRLQIGDWAKDSTRYGNFKDISDLLADIKNSSLGQKLIAQKRLADVKTDVINMDLEDIELKDYLQDDFFRMVFKYKKRRAIHHEIHFVVSMRFKIIADPL